MYLNTWIHPFQVCFVSVFLLNAKERERTTTWKPANWVLFLDVARSHHMTVNDLHFFDPKSVCKMGIILSYLPYRVLVRLKKDICINSEMLQKSNINFFFFFYKFCSIFFSLEANCKSVWARLFYIVFTMYFKNLLITK